MKKFRSFMRKVNGSDIDINQLGRILCTHIKDGSSDTTIFEVHTMAKCGQIDTLRQEAELYCLFKKKIRSGFRKIFPETYLITLKDGKSAILLIEMVHGKNMEDETLAIGVLANQFGQRHAQTQTQQKKVKRMTARVIDLLDILHRPVAPSSELRGFIEELRVALSNNLREAGLSLPSIISLNNPQWWEGGVASLAHRDLSVVNILGDAKRVKLIDPRPVVPGGVNGASYASPAIDLAALDVSLERKEMEIQKMTNYSLTIEARDLVRRKIHKMVKKREISERLLNLAYATIYASYAACKCSYCLAKDRVWLYQAMLEKTKVQIGKL